MYNVLYYLIEEEEVFGGGLRYGQRTAVHCGTEQLCSAMLAME